MLFPELAGLREDARELETESFLLAGQGKYSTAITNQALGFRVAQQAASDPTLINYLVGGRRRRDHAGRHAEHLV